MKSNTTSENDYKRRKSKTHKTEINQKKIAKINEHFLKHENAVNIHSEPYVELDDKDSSMSTIPEQSDIVIHI